MRLLIAPIVLVLTGCVAAPSARELLAGPNAVQHLVEGRPRDIPPELAELKSVAPYSTRFDLVLPGRRAAFRVGNSRPTFLSIYPGTEMNLFRLEPGVEHDDRNLKVRVRAADAWGTPRFEIPRDVVVELEASREGDGLYRVTPASPLPPGEYAFLSQVDLDRWQKYPHRVRIYAFGVD
jgi:hypothetical protein